jgi:tetratricopeptide (TPR) repeat protein
MNREESSSPLAAATPKSKNRSGWLPLMGRIIGWSFGFLLGKFLGLGFFMLLIGGWILFVVGQWLSNRYLLSRAETSKLVRFTKTANWFAWLFPIFGALVAGATLQLASNLKQHQERVKALAFTGLALSLCNALVGAFDKMSDSYTKMAEGSLHEKKYDEAIEAANNAISRSIWGASNAHYVRARAEVAKEQYDSALADLDQFRDPWPDDYMIFYSRAALRYRYHRYAEALKDINEFITNSTENADAFALRGTIEQKLGKDENARQDFERAQQLGYSRKN